MTIKDRYTSIVNKNKHRLAFLIKYTVFATAAVMLALVISLAVDLIGPGKTIRLEAGNELPSAEEISKKSGAVYEYDADSIDISRVGEYKINIVYGKNERMKIRLKVVDTQPPKGKVLSLSIDKNSSVLPEAEDFFEKISEASDYSARFVNAPKLDGFGSYDIKISLEDEYGNGRTYETSLSVIDDTQAPVFTYLPANIVGYIGQGISYKKDVEVHDNCFGVSLDVDTSKVDTTKVGTYSVTYIATDAAGNKATSIPVSVYIYEQQITDEMLDQKISEIAKELGMSKSLPKEELCKRIYKYVNDPNASASEARFRYVGNSNDKTRGDWRREAWLTIQNGQGDCYSYFAVSKAFFEYFDIENKDIERSAGLTPGETHFWSMVNIGSSSSPRWYFFDATRYAGRFEIGGDNGCLMTLAQIQSYAPNRWSYEASKYYAFDSEQYPSVSTEEINADYSWR